MEHGISVIIVEDEEIWIASLTRMLDDFGYNIVKTVSTVEDALAAFSTCEYDLILMDINLDGRNSGIELGNIVNKLYHKPFIFITADTDNKIKEASRTNPAAYITKPINPTALFIAIQNAIQHFQNDTQTAVHEHETGEQELTSFFVKQGTRYKKIDWKDVAYLSSGKNYISVFNAADKTEYYIRSSLQKILQYTVPKNLQKHFIQVNRSEAVQLSYIQEIMNDEVKTAFKTFSVSDTYIKELKSKINIF